MKELVDRFLVWPLPKTVRPDPCVMIPDYPHPMSGTNLLTATEAEAMLEHVAGPALESLQARVKELEESVLSEHQAAVDMFSKYDAAREENARLQKLVDMNQRVVDAVRDHKRLDAHMEQCMCPICASIRELDGEKCEHRINSLTLCESCQKTVLKD